MLPESVVDDVEPDCEVDCPYCDGTIALFIDRVGEEPKQCSVAGVVHLQGGCADDVERLDHAPDVGPAASLEGDETGAETGERD